MTSTAIPEIKETFAVEAYGVEIRLWKSSDANWWGGMLRTGKDVLYREFHEENLTLAQLHLLAEARNIAAYRGCTAALLPSHIAIQEWRQLGGSN